ncbi:helix-turn-helix transcriptional regulator [Roseibium sediminicola]|uniref:LuxR C-terminal-related transcriptional regulator n=1 Tax=Roseibium sediminicola TaxID=2933272 RepID=A0ABT0GN59_9HYPH|nr:LuxR C-terminal-related transcriptional regulator [Roseibium sp. CAU 1639]MCK7610852.1 LuxR C-terminal-related transcriptional regulator [Roseibium sp. CAU 1639]
MLLEPMGTLAFHMDACLETLGSDTFAPAFAELVETLDIDQIMVFSIEGTRARCLLSRHFSNAALAGKLAGAYLDGWYLKDPLLTELLAATSNAVSVRRLEEIEADMPPDYRTIFFEAPGMLAKTTALATGERLRLFVSLYQTREGAVPVDPDLARLVGRLALQHFERVEETDVPPPLAALSEREQAVCLGILSGRKAEAIAADLGVAASTVITYRKRAYAKLGITARAGLFVLCGR